MARIIRMTCCVFLVCVAGAAIAERQYAPDRTADILHITIDVTPDFKTRTVAGTTTIKFAPISKPLVEFRLDAADLDVSSVTSNAKIEGYTATDKAITITFEPAVPVGAETCTSARRRWAIRSRTHTFSPRANPTRLRTGIPTTTIPTSVRVQR